MARTNVKGTQVLDGSVGRADLNTTVSGSAVITKLSTSNGVAMTAYTGTDSGTGDVTVAADLAFLDTKYPSITTSRTQNHLLAAPASGNGAASFRALVAGDIPAIAISGVTGLQTALNAKLSGAGTTNYLAKYTGSTTIDNSSIYDSGAGIGIGTTIVSDYVLRIVQAVTGSSNRKGISLESDLQIDITVYNAFQSIIGTGADANPVTVRHFYAAQGSHSGSLQNQYGFYVDALTGATNNYGFYGNIASGTNRYNLYMPGTANNYFAGNLGIGVIIPTAKLDINGTARITGSNVPSSGAGLELQYVSDQGEILSYDRTNSAYMPFRLRALTIQMYGGGTGGIDITNTGNIGIGTSAPSTRLSLGTFWNTSAETVGINLREGSTSGDLPAYGFGFGPASSEGYINYRSGTSSSSVFGHKFFVNNVEVMRIRGDGNFGIGTSTPIYKLDVAGNARLTSNLIITGAIANGNTIAHFDNNNTTTDQSFGLLIDAGTSTNDYTLKLRNASTTEMLIFNGAGSLGIGGTGSLINSSTLTLAKPFSNTTSHGIYNYGQITSNNTGNAYYYRSLANTQAANFTVSAIVHYSVAQGTIGVNSSVTNQYGFLVENTMIGASNNYGFYSSLSSGNWNLYMSGTGSNFMNGRLGIGSNVLVDRNLQLVLPITGGSTAYGMISNGQVQSGVTVNAYQYFSQANAAVDVALTSFSHYTAVHGTIGGSITNQNGFYVPSLIGASNNYAFRGSVTNTAGAWNLYMDGSANNYIGSKIGVGTFSIADRNFALGLPLSSSTPYNFMNFGTVQTSASSIFMNYSQANVASGANASSLYHFVASQAALSGTIGNQFGFFASSALTGGTTNYGFYGNLPAGTGLWNLYMNGNANNYIAGKLGIGTTTLTNANINITLPITGNTIYYAISNSGIVQNDVSNAVYYRTSASTQSGSFTVSNLVHFGAYKSLLGSPVTNQIGYYVDNTLTGASNNYGFFGSINSGFGQWNFYAGGTANNYFAGNVWIGTNTGSFKLDVNGNARFTQDVQFDNHAICDTAPTDANHLTNKAYVDSLPFIKRGESVKTIALTNISLSGTQTINDVSLIAGDLILVAGQTTGSQNGVYVVATGAWSRSTNNDFETEIKGAYHHITAGNYSNQRYINTNNSTITVGTTAISYTLDFGAETDPVSSAFKSAYDITPTRINNWNDAYSNRISTKTTTDLSEGSNLYFTTARVLATALSGYSIGTNTALVATDTILQAFQKLQGQVNSRLLIGGNSIGAAITVGTNDAFDFSLERNNTPHLSLLSGVSKFFFDVDIVGKLKLNGSTGADHQFIKYNGTSTVWSTLDTGELSDKNDIVMLATINGERGFQMFSDSAKAYAESFIFTNPDAGISLGIHGFTLDGSNNIKEFGLQLETDGYLYHRKLDGTRSRIATVDMLTGGGATWNGGYVTNDISFPQYQTLYFNRRGPSDFTGLIYANETDYYGVPYRSLSLISRGSVTIAATQFIQFQTRKEIGGSYGDTAGVVIDGVLLDLQSVDSLVGGFARFQVIPISPVGGQPGFYYKLKLVAA